MVSNFYLNHKYADHYVKICRLVLDNRHIFELIRNKDSFKIFQILLVKYRTAFTNADFLTFFSILHDPQHLNRSLNVML